VSRYFDDRRSVKVAAVVRDVVIVALILVLVSGFWPFRSVPTGTRGVLTQFGAIKQIEPEGLVFVPPWQHIQLFSIRAEAADINKASGSTIDQQNVDTDLTVRYNIKPDKVAEVYEQYSHDGDLQSYVQTATQETFKAVTARYTAPELISGQTCSRTLATIAAFSATGRERNEVDRIAARFAISAPRSSSALRPPCSPMITSRPLVASASTLRAR